MQTVPTSEGAKAFFSEPERYLEKNHRIAIRCAVVRQLLGDLRNQRILDLGCGDGSISAQFLPAGNRITMVDLSAPMLECAKSATPAQYRDAVEYVNASVNSFAADNLYDVVLCIGVLAHVDSPEETVAKVSSLLKPGGRCVFQLTDDAQALSKVGQLIYSARRLISRSAPAYPRMSLDEIAAIADRHGLKLVAQRRHLVALPGVVKLLGRWLVPYDLMVMRTPWMSRHGVEVSFLCTKD